LDEVFGNTQFRSKIIWTYKRWSNAQKGLLPAYQEIFFYSKSNQFKFNKIYNNYSPTTNVDQILQKRVRDNRGKTVYAKSEEGLIISSDEKLGVPLSDVWEIPFLNPKASERVGYPTQKPILLLEKIIQLTTSEGDTVLDPFCGSGTTLVASKLLNRQFVGIDISEQAIKTTQNRLDNPIKTSSKLCENGVDSYYNTDNPVASYLPKNSYSMVHRNKGIDAILTQKKEGKQVLVRVQRQWESLAQAAMLLLNASLKKTEVLPVLIITRTDEFLGYLQASYPSLCFLNSIELQLSSLVATDLPLSNEINVGSSAR
jgi:site-specific DNA-methyltransferase (adenine-specific)